MADEETIKPTEEQELQTVKQAIEGKEGKSERIEEEQYIFKQVRSITFSVLSPKMIKKMASAKIVTPELYDKEGYPVDGGKLFYRKKFHQNVENQRFSSTTENAMRLSANAGFATLLLIPRKINWRRKF